MCTATWRCESDSYVLYFNRDESRARAAERPARIFRRGGVESIAPLDGGGGGTWIGVNEFGFSACLLNLYPSALDPVGSVDPVDPVDPPAAPRTLSRGHLVIGLLDSSDVREARARFLEEDLRWFRPFRLLTLAPGEPPSCFVWSGEHLVERELSASEDQRGLVCSSGWDDAEANRVRGRAWESMVASGPPSDAALLAFHESHDTASGAASVCMHRDDAATVSLVKVRVDAGVVELLHSRGAPCSGVEGRVLRLPRRALRRGGRAVLAGVAGGSGARSGPR
ncbi:MAG: NRDE family protein [Acidobacteriota bacterium]